MSVRMETREPLEILRHSGTHASSDRDHERDDLAKQELAERVCLGRDRYLLDVRELHVFYRSGMGDLFNSWRPVHENRARGALLWKPSRREGFDRWAYFAGLPMGGFRFFQNEAEALVFLLSDKA